MIEFTNGDIMAEVKPARPHKRFWATQAGSFFASVLLEGNPADKNKPYLGRIESPHATGPVPFIMRRRFSCFERAEAWAIDTAKDLSNGASLPE